MLPGKEPRCQSPCTTLTSSYPAKPQNRHVQLLMKFNEDIFKRNVLTDVECIVEGQTFKTHRAVLICFSPYLKRKLVTAEGKPTTNKIQIPKIGPEEFEILLQYMYTGNLGVDCNSFLDVYKAASLLEMEDAKLECLQIIDGKNEIRTYFYAYVLCKTLGLQQNWQRAFKLILHRFEESVFSNEFMKLNLNYVMEILSAQTIGARSETIIFLAALNWLNHDYSRRGEHAATVMSCVRFSSMTMEEIVACYHPPFLSHVVQIPEVMMMLFRATCYIAAKSEGQENWFKEYASPKRNLILECLPMELWHKKTHPQISATTDSQRQTFGTPLEKKNSDLWNIESKYSRLLKDPIEDIVGNTGHERMEEGINFKSSSYDYPVNEKDETADALQSTIKNYFDHDSFAECHPLYPESSTSPSENENFKNLQHLKDFNEGVKLKNKYNADRVKFCWKPTSFKTQENLQKDTMCTSYNLSKREPYKLNRRNLTSPNVIQLVLPRETKVIHLSKGPKMFYPFEPEFGQKKDLYAKEQTDPTKRAHFKPMPHEGDIGEIATKVPDVGDSSMVRNEKVSGEDESKINSREEEKHLERGNAARTVERNITPAGKAVESETRDKNSLEKNSLTSEKVASNKHSKKENDCILVVGGMNPKNFKEDAGGEIFSLDIKLDKWIFFSQTPEPRHNHCAAYLNNFLYVVGGCNPEETIHKNRYVAKRTCFKLDLENLAWRVAREMRCCRYDHGLVVYDGKLYAIGGQDENGKLLKSVEVYDPARNRWKGLSPNMCCGRKAMGVAAYDDRIWVVGGLTESAKSGQLQVVSHVDCYNPGEKKWYFNLYSLPESLCFCSLVVWEEKLYCLGGMVRADGEGTRASDKVWFVERGNQLWKKGPHIPKPRMGGIAIVFKNCLYFLGGFDPGGDSNNQNVHFLTPNTTSWVTGPSLPSHLFGLSAVSF